MTDIHQALFQLLYLGCWLFLSVPWWFFNIRIVIITAALAIIITPMTATVLPPIIAGTSIPVSLLAGFVNTDSDEIFVTNWGTPHL